MSTNSPTQLDDALTAKRDALLERLNGYGRVAVAFSAGVDSTVVAKAVQLACGDHAVAVTAASPSLASGELEEARRLASLIGIRHEVIHTSEFQNSDYLKNAPDRCYFCKTELYTQLEGLAPRLGVDVIVNGANVDDQGDHRPGMRAASEHAIRSPLLEIGFTKADVRELAKHWELPVWDKPATPCLSSRIAYGLEVTPERVRRVDLAERFLREEFSLRELRVRHEQNELARIEVPGHAIPTLLESGDKVSAKLREFGFRYVTVDLDGFRSGSMNQFVPLELLERVTTSEPT